MVEYNPDTGELGEETRKRKQIKRKKQKPKKQQQVDEIDTVNHDVVNVSSFCKFVFNTFKKKVRSTYNSASKWLCIWARFSLDSCICGLQFFTFLMIKLCHVLKDLPSYVKYVYDNKKDAEKIVIGTILFLFIFFTMFSLCYTIDAGLNSNIMYTQAQKIKSIVAELVPSEFVTTMAQDIYTVLHEENIQTDLFRKETLNNIDKVDKNLNQFKQELLEYKNDIKVIYNYILGIFIIVLFSPILLSSMLFLIMRKINGEISI